MQKLFFISKYFEMPISNKQNQRIKELLSSKIEQKIQLYGRESYKHAFF